jgi:hypothetical protein
MPVFRRFLSVVALSSAFGPHQVKVQRPRIISVLPDETLVQVFQECGKAAWRSLRSVAVQEECLKGIGGSVMVPPSLVADSADIVGGICFLNSAVKDDFRTVRIRI